MMNDTATVHTVLQYCLCKQYAVQKVLWPMPLIAATDVLVARGANSEVKEDAVLERCLLNH